jgi:hypothetical protein
MRYSIVPSGESASYAKEPSSRIVSRVDRSRVLTISNSVVGPGSVVCSTRKLPSREIASPAPPCTSTGMPNDP